MGAVNVVLWCIFFRRRGESSIWHQGSLLPSNSRKAHLKREELYWNIPDIAWGWWRSWERDCSEWWVTQSKFPFVREPVIWNLTVCNDLSCRPIFVRLKAYQNTTESRPSTRNKSLSSPYGEVVVIQQSK